MKIEELRDIVRVIRRNEYLAGAPLDFRRLLIEDSKLAEFYKIVVDPEIESEEEVVSMLYKKGNSSNKYKSLKSYFLSRAVNNITFFELSKTGKSEYVKAIFKAYKYLFVVRVLLTLGSRSGAICLAKKTLKLAQKYEIHSVIVDLLGELMTHALQLGHEKEFAKYLEMSTMYKGLLMNESRVVIFQQQIAINFTKSLFISEKLRNQIGVSLTEAKALLAKGDTYLGRISYYRLLYVSYQVAGQPLKSAAACDEAIKYMSGKQHMSPPSRFAEFALYKLENYILLRDYDRGKEAVIFCEKHINKGMNLWFSFKEYEFLLMMQTTRFEEAHTIYKEVREHERFNSLSLHLQELWQILGLHIEYAVRSYSPKNEARSSSTFRKSYMMRNRAFKVRLFDFPTYRKDKRGFNVAILTLNILVALEENNLDLLLQQEEALSSYRFRYLNEKHCKQSFILFKLIRLVTKNDFDLTKIEKKAEAFEKELDSYRLKAGEIFEGIQILPSQWVWDRIKIILANRK